MELPECNESIAVLAIVINMPVACKLAIVGVNSNSKKSALSQHEKIEIFANILKYLNTLFLSNSYVLN